jgi:hypothetical protein
MENKSTSATVESRNEPRIPINCQGLSFLGTRANDRSCFQYLLTNVSPSGVGFALPNHLKNRERFLKGDRVHFHVPFKLSDHFYNEGTVRWTDFDPTTEGQCCGAELDKQSALHYPVYVSFQTREITFPWETAGFRSTKHLLQSIVKDALLLKRGMLIYYRHLTPFFLKIGALDPRDYPVLKTIFLQDVDIQLNLNITTLKKILATVEQPDFSVQQIEKQLDLDVLRETIEPEIDANIFRNSFRSGNVVPYLDSLKTLEGKLYMTYNTVVLMAVLSRSNKNGLKD